MTTTPVRGLEIYQGKMKCLREKPGQGPRIDQFTKSVEWKPATGSKPQLAGYQHPCHSGEEGLHS